MPAPIVSHRRRLRTLASIAVPASYALSIASSVVSNMLGDTPGYVVAMALAAFVLAFVGLVLALLGRAWVWSALAVLALIVGAAMSLAAIIANDIDFSA